MKNWRSAYRSLAPEHQMMVATILWLYRGGPDKLWLRGCPSTCHAADTVAALKRSDMLQDWGTLVALYPGW